MCHFNAHFSLYDLVLNTYYLFMMVITLDEKQIQDTHLNFFKILFLYS